MIGEIASAAGVIDNPMGPGSRGRAAGPAFEGTTSLMRHDFGLT